MTYTNKERNDFIQQNMASTPEEKLDEIIDYYKIHIDCLSYSVYLSKRLISITYFLIIWCSLVAIISTMGLLNYKISNRYELVCYGSLLVFSIFEFIFSNKRIESLKINIGMNEVEIDKELKHLFRYQKYKEENYGTPQNE